MTFLSNLIYTFLIAIGVMLGASFFAGLGALLNGHPPLKTMLDLARSIKIWAVIVSLGGTFSSFEIIEKSILRGEIRSVIKQIVYIVSALLGSNIGYGIIKWLQKCGRMWKV